eukprot:5843205-Prymnesium_polylepis.1
MAGGPCGAQAAQVVVLLPLPRVSGAAAVASRERRCCRRFAIYRNVSGAAFTCCAAVCNDIGQPNAPQTCVGPTAAAGGRAA